MKNNYRDAKAPNRLELSTYSNSQLKMLGENLFIALCSDTAQRISEGEGTPSDYSFVKSIDAAGEALGISRRQVDTVIGGFAGLMRPKIQVLPPEAPSKRELDERVPELFRQQKSIREIARKLRTTKYQVEKRVNKLKPDDPNQQTFPFSSEYPSGIQQP